VCFRRMVAVFKLLRTVVDSIETNKFAGSNERDQYKRTGTAAPLLHLCLHAFVCFMCVIFSFRCALLFCWFREGCSFSCNDVTGADGSGRQAAAATAAAESDGAFDWGAITLSSVSPIAIVHGRPLETLQVTPHSHAESHLVADSRALARVLLISPQLMRTLFCLLAGAVDCMG
jgi:hypothetical protein